jgi:hypothetical protein
MNLYLNNEINYIIKNTVDILDENNEFIFKETKTKIIFKNKITSRIDGHDFYKQLRK